MIEEENEGKKPISAITKFKVHEINPFIEIMEFKTGNQTKMIGKKIAYIEDKINGNATLEQMAFGIRQTVDKEEFVKIFSSNIRKTFNLSLTAFKLFGYVCEAMKINEDTIVFNILKAMESTGLKSKTSVNIALTELLDKNILARTNEYYIYYINPAVVFKGNRMLLVQDYILDENLDKNHKNTVIGLEKKRQEKMDKIHQQKLFTT